MAVKVFLDANVLLDFILKREQHENAEKIVALIIANQVRGFITSSVLHIVGYWVTKAYGSAKAKELLATLLADITVIDIPHETALIALHSKINDIEDALQYYTALHHKLDFFISRDKHLQKNTLPALPVLLPGEFFKIFK